MDKLNPLLIAVVPALLTYLGTKYKSQNEREQHASTAWKELYNETKERMDKMQAQMESLNNQISEMKKKHADEIYRLEIINNELREENKLLKIKNKNYKNRLIQLGDEF